MQPRKASSVVLLRQGKGKQLEVLMAQRSKNLKSFAGAFVFPGGVAESCDGEEGTREQSKRCGLRELFEEAGVLLAKSRVGNRAKPVSFASKEERREWQKRVKDNPKEFDQLLKEKNATLATDALFYWVTFITPIFESRRFDTDFFIVDSKYEEGGLELDESETASLVWISPQEAITKNSKGEMPFLPPQYFILSTIMQAGSSPKQIVESIVNRSTDDEFLPILPHPIESKDQPSDGDGVITLTYPGDEQHSIFPGAPGNRNRLKTKLGGKGFKLERNLPHFSLTKKEWSSILSSKSKL